VGHAVPVRAQHIAWLMPMMRQPHGSTPLARTGTNRRTIIWLAIGFGVTCLTVGSMFLTPAARGAIVRSTAATTPLATPSASPSATSGPVTASAVASTADDVASTLGDSTPGPVSIYAATRRDADPVTDDVEASGGQPPSAQAWITVLPGAFTSANLPAPPGATITTANTLVVVLDSQGNVTDIGLDANAPTMPADVGPPTTVASG
jgi:hypothetical protein